VSVPAGTREQVLIRVPNWLGDAVLALPALAAIRRHLSGAHLTIAAPASVASLFRETTTGARPDAVLDLPESSRATIAAIRRGHFTSAILLPNSFRSAWQVYRARVPVRSGFATSGRGFLLTQRVPRPNSSDSRHHSDYYRALVRGLQIPCPEDELPQVHATAAGQARADELFALVKCPPDRPLVVLMPGAANSQAKQWLPERMAELSARLVRERGVVCVMAGAAHDRAASRAIESWLRARAPDAASGVLDLVGRTSLGALAAVLDRAAVCVSNDAGGMHLASALGRPVVAIFGPTDERSTRPAGDHDLIVEPVFCRPCMLRDCPIDHRCMTRIPVDRVFGAVAGRLSRGAR
jgi:heptosyltransferase-2